MTHGKWAQEPRKDFFISYSSADRTWAEWIDWQLKTEGYSTILPDQGLRSGSIFALEIDRIFKEAKQVIVVISPYYLNALYGQLEWAVILRQEATREHGLLVLVQVRECRRALKSLIGAISFIDLVGQDESLASKKLMSSLDKNYRSSKSNGSAIVSHLHKDKAEQEFIKKKLSFLRRQGMTSEWQEFDMDGVESAALPVHNMPYQRNLFFTDREEILNRLHDTLREGRAMGISQPLALSGLGGIGKTQIALEYAYRYKDDYHFILWAQADKYGSLVKAFMSMARVLRLPERDLQEDNQVVVAVKRWLEDNAYWLLILDNVDDLATASDFIPVESQGDILLTTCAYAMGTIAQSVIVDKLEPEDGAKLLLHRIKAIAPDKTLSEADHAAAEKIAREMDGIPLALDQAGAYIEKMQCTLADYLKSYSNSKRRTELLKERGEPSFAHSDSVTATWLLSFENATKAYPAAADLLRLCAFLAPDSIPEEIITQGAKYLGPRLEPVAARPFELDRAIEELRKFSLISRNADKNTLSMHSLVQEVLKEQMKGDAERRLWAERAVQAVNYVYPDEEFNTWEQCERYSSQAQACADLIEGWQMRFPEAARLLHEAGSYLFERAQFEQAHALYEQALDIREHILDSDDLQIAASYNDLAWLYRTIGKYGRAEVLFKQALAIREKQLGPEDPQVAQTLNDLAWLYFNQGKYSDAEPLYRRALEIREKALELNDPNIATSLNNLAWLYYTQGRYSEAEALYKRALAIREQTLPGNHPYLATSLDNLARLYRMQGKYEQAEAFYQRALGIRVRALGPEHPDVALSLSGLALLYHVQGQYEQSEKLYQQALTIRKRTLGEEHPHVARTLNNLGRLYRAQGRYQQSDEWYQQALAIRERVLGPEHPDVAQSLNNLARLYRIQGRYEDAEQLHNDALAMRKKALGDEHLDVAQTLNNQVKLYRLQGRYEHAEHLSKQAYAVWEKMLGPRHPYLALILNNLGEVYQFQGRYAEAERSYQRALEIQAKATGYQHTNVALILNHLAEIAVSKGEYEQAETMLRQALDIRQQVLGEKHPHIAHSLDILSEVHRAQGQYAQAEALLQQAVAIRWQTLGPEHPDLANSLYNLAELYAVQGRYEEAESLYLEALTIREKSLRTEHLDVAITLHHLADLYQAQEKNRRAEVLYQRALAIYERIEGQGLDEMLLAMEHFATLLRKMEQEARAMELLMRVQKLRETQVPEIPPSHEEVERER